MRIKKPGSKIRAVIFDMDGVIVDSMPYHYLAWYEALRPYGVRVTCFDLYSKEGEKWEKSTAYFLKRSGLVPTKRLLAGVLARKKRIFRKYFKRHIFKGAEEILRMLKKEGYAIALVTGSSEGQARTMLPRRIYRRFDHVVAGDHVKMGKPHPEPYLKAAGALDVDPSECLVVENAPFGIESAKRAGMRCVAISTSLPRGYLGKADAITDDLSGIINILKRGKI